MDFKKMDKKELIKYVKKILFLFLFISLILTGCSSNGKEVHLEKDKESKKNYDEYLGIEYIKKYDINCVALKDAKYFNYNLFSTNSDEIYIFFLDKLFSNDEHYRKFDKNEITNFQGEKMNINKIVGISSSIYGDIGGFVDAKAQSIYPSLNGSINGDSYGIKDQSMERYNELMNSDEWHCSENGFMIRKNNKWLFNENYVDYEIFDIPALETIVSINRNIIKTDKAFYILKSKITNKEECNKYADIKCDTRYFVEKINPLNRIFDKVIAAYDINNVITFVSNEGIIYEIKN